MSADMILTFLIEGFVSSGIIWAATMALKSSLRRQMSPKTHLAVWLVLVARLILPVTIDTGIHLITVPAINTDVVHEAGDTDTQQLLPLYQYGAKELFEGSMRTGTATEQSKAPYGGSMNGTKPVPKGARLNWEYDPAELAVSVWLLGILTGTAISLTGYDRMRRDIRRRLVPGSDPLHVIFQECLREMGIRSRVVLAVQNELAGPALMYPNIVLIPDAMHDMAPDTVRMALLHELTHFSRRDHIRSAGLNALRIVWWFNPFVWFAVRTIREDIETACDGDVVYPLGKAGRKAYANSVLSMYGRTETCQAVLGMAFGGTRRNAERRIRGIYMKRKSSVCGRTAALCMAGILSVACLTTACQPTPEMEAVVNQKDGIPESALIGESRSADPEATTAPAAQYQTAEHWSETIDKADNFRVIADVDVMMPDVSEYTVGMVAQRDITEELVARLIDEFAPGAQLYDRQTTATKADLEDRILELQEEIEERRARGDLDNVEYGEEMLEELKSAYGKAPETSDRKTAAIEFTYATDYETGEQLTEEGPVHLEVEADTPEGTVQFSARKRVEGDPLRSAYFYYTAPYTCSTETNDISNAEAMESEREYTALLDEPDRSEALERLDDLEKATNRRLPVYAQNSIDLNEAKLKGEQLLERLDIRGAQVFTAQKAIIEPSDRNSTFLQSADDGTNTNLMRPGVYMEFQREINGIPCITQMVQHGIQDTSEKQYSAPFMPERGTILMDADWNVLMFTWENPTVLKEIVAPDSKLIPLDEAKTRLVDALYRAQTPDDNTYMNEFGLEYIIEEMKLVMGYVDIKDNPDDALAVPAWFIRATGTQMPDGEGSSDVVYNVDETMINALDGSTILMPGTAQNYNIG